MSHPSRAPDPALSVVWTAAIGTLLLLATSAFGPAWSGGAVAGRPDGVPGNGPPGGGQQPATAFVGVHVIAMDRERVLADQTVVVRDGRIVRIGPSAQVAVPAAAMEIDARGKYLIPGLAEMHAHIPSRGGRPFMERVLLLYLANGITTVRGMLGQPAHLKLRADVARGAVLGPRIYTSGPSLNGNSIPDPDSARRAVLHQAAAGYDFLKIHPGLTRAEYDAIARTADSVGIRWAGHVPADVGLAHALEAGQATVDHLDQYMEMLVPENADPGLEPLFFGVELVDQVDESKIPAVAAASRRVGVWNVPTQSLIERILGPEDPERMARRSEMRYMPSEMVRSWVKAKKRFLSHPTYTPERAERFIEIRRHIIKALQDGGAGLLLGSDAPQVFQVPGFSIHAELQALVAAGLSPYQALAAGTRNVAAFFGTLDESGTVAQGKIADLVLLEANPLADIRNVARRAGVMVRGRWLPEQALQARLDSIAKASP
ncbi:MAG: amidohydrolase family protein [Gemmatimonadota bacterium]